MSTIMSSSGLPGRLATTVPVQNAVRPLRLINALLRVPVGGRQIPDGAGALVVDARGEDLQRLGDRAIAASRVEVASGDVRVVGDDRRVLLLGVVRVVVDALGHYVFLTIAPRATSMLLIAARPSSSARKNWRRSSLAWPSPCRARGVDVVRVRGQRLERGAGGGEVPAPRVEGGQGGGVAGGGG